MREEFRTNEQQKNEENVDLIVKNRKLLISQFSKVITCRRFNNREIQRNWKLLDFNNLLNFAISILSK